MLLITKEVACRLETAEAIDAAGCAEAQCRAFPGCHSAVKPVAGGVAVFCGSDSPLTHALGIGMHGSVSAGELDELEAFFEKQDAPIMIDLCPYADPSLRELLTQRNYRMVEFSHVMARGVPAGEELPPVLGVEVRQASPEEIDLYVSTVIGGFFGRMELNEQEQRLGRTLFHMPCSSSYLAFVDGQAAGGGGISIRNKVASLFGDATLPAFRGKGAHTALIQARLQEARAAGCDLVTAGTQPGSGSQTNYQRLGFQIAYTKLTMMRD